MGRAREAEAAAELADEAVAQLAQGGELEAVAEEAGGTASEATEISRDGTDRGSLSIGLVNEVFELDVGDAAAAATLDGGQVIARLLTVTAVDTGDSAESVEAIRQRETNIMAQEIVDQFTAALRQQFSVDIDDEAIADIADPS